MADPSLTPLLLGSSLVLAVLTGAVLIVVYSLRTGISPMPSTARARAAMGHLLTAASHGSTGPIYELGSGWGNLAFSLADLFPNRQVIAYELSPLPYLVSRIRQWLASRANLSIRRENFFEVSLEKASGIVCYLGPAVMERLAQKLQSEVLPGTPVVSNTFSLPRWSSERVHVMTDLYATRVYLYRVPPS